MSKIALISMFFAVTATSVTAQQATNPIEKGVDAVDLCPEVAKRVSELREHGDRFETAIQLIHAEAAKPTWGWDWCEATEEQLAASTD